MENHKSESPGFPNFAGKHAEASMFTPQDFLAYAREHRSVVESVPPNLIMCYSPWLGRKISDRDDARPVLTAAAGSFHVLSFPKGEVGVCSGFGIGAPAASTVMEELIACGAQRILSIGAAGSLQQGIEAGEVMICTAAIRDEGVSHHYLEPSAFSYPSENLTRRLKKALVEETIHFREGAAWTIDAPYRETVAEARHYQREGVLAVEMEAAAVFAIAQYRGVEAAAAFVASDSLAELTWTPQFGAPRVRQSLETLLQVSIAAFRLEEW